MDRALSDRIALDDLLTAYAVAIDADPLGDLAALATDDAVFDYTSSGGPRASVAEVSEWLTKALAFVPSRQHLIVNRVFTLPRGGEPEVDAGSGAETYITPGAVPETASVAAYFFNPMSVHAPGPAGTTAWNPGGGHYDVTFRRTPDGWRISELVMRETWRIAVPGQASGRH